jgi:hypothetical protein
MSLRFALVTAVLFAGSTVAASALPLDQLSLPSDPTLAAKKKDSTDGLFNHNMPDHWTNASSDHAADDSGLGHMHFSMHSSNDFGPANSDYGDASKPMSEFYGPKPVQNDNTDPLFNH